MMNILTLADVQHVIDKTGLTPLFQLVTEAMESDFCRWHEFQLSPRHATHYAHGVIELMPCSDNLLYSYKYVNGHPSNPKDGRLSVIALGQLSDVSTGYPVMISEMTLLTAIRTAVTGILAGKYLARRNSSSLAIIGTGSQAEFQVSALASYFPIKVVRFYDIDAKAMHKFETNLANEHYKLIACHNISQALASADIVITATAAKKKQSLFNQEDISPGTHIHAMGGDCPGKTEFDAVFLSNSKVVVEYNPQSLLEGEMQQCSENDVYAELWELVCNKKPGRTDEKEITLFDSVGFALEDFSILRVFYSLAKKYQLGTELTLIPELDDPKNLFSLIKNNH